MYAVIQTGGKQYSVEVGTVLDVEKLGAEVGTEVVFNDVLLVKNESSTIIGVPYVEGAEVIARVVEHSKGPKLIAFKKWRRNGKQWKKGHRQNLSRVIIEKVGVGAKP